MEELKIDTKDYAEQKLEDLELKLIKLISKLEIIKNDSSIELQRLAKAVSNYDTVSIPYGYDIEQYQEQQAIITYEIEVTKAQIEIYKHYLAPLS